jgi:hypothetical protein
MRLLERNNNSDFSLTKDFGRHVSWYPILSDTWEADTEEVTFRDLVDGTRKSKAGYSKIRFCAEQASRRPQSKFTGHTLQATIEDPVPMELAGRPKKYLWGAYYVQGAIYVKLRHHCRFIHTLLSAHRGKSL